MLAGGGGASDKELQGRKRVSPQTSGWSPHKTRIWASLGSWTKLRRQHRRPRPQSRGAAHRPLSRGATPAAPQPQPPQAGSASTTQASVWLPGIRALVPARGPPPPSHAVHGNIPRRGILIDQSVAFFCSLFICFLFSGQTPPGRNVFCNRVTRPATTSKPFCAHSNLSKLVSSTPKTESSLVSEDHNT